MEVKQRNIGNKSIKMPKYRYRRCSDDSRRHRAPPRRGRLTWKLLACLLSIPLGALYAGYAVGNYLMPTAPRLPDRGVVADIGRLNYSWYNTHNVTVEFVGGLGNQMFQYASLYGIAKANGLRPLVTLDNRLLDVFPLLKAGFVLSDRELTGYGRFNEFGFAVYDGRTFSLNFMKNIVLEGFFQSWRYFDHARSDVRRQFRFRSEVGDKAARALRDIYATYRQQVDPRSVADSGRAVQFVGVHIRRGDMLEPQLQDKGYTTADGQYLHRAVTYYDVTYKNIVYVVCTDDVEWARANVKTSSPTSLVVLSPFVRQHPAYDLCLLSLCNHTIMTVGTFGWWAGWLAGGDVVYFKNFPKPSSAIAKKFSPSDYYLPQWIGL